MTVAVGEPRRAPLAAATAVTLGVGVIAWVGTLVWAADMGMGAEPGTMGLDLAGFILLWTLMMAAMMRPAIAPLVTLYARTVRDHRRVRLAAFGSGFVLAWALTGFVAFALASLFDALAEDRPAVAHAVAVGSFAVCGLYQLTPMKQWCLRHCRSPLGHLIKYAGYKGHTRDLRAGLHHGLVCVGCCWMLMVALVAVGVMNVAAMVGIALVIALEKRWRYGEQLAKVAGIAALAFAVVLVFDGGLAPGLHDSGVPMDMDEQMQMP
jgi:predicted metal-binding membrane protein